ncbi:uncharacterized protein [Antedon mediterranea]
MEFSTETEKVEELILDFALQNNMYQVIQGFTANKGQEYFLKYRRSTSISDVRIFSPTISLIVKNEDIENFDKVIRMLTHMYEEHPEAVSLQSFSQIMIVFKIKTILYEMSKEFQFSKMLSKLDEYFPSKPNNPKIHKYKTESWRKILKGMICSQPKERLRIKERLEEQYNKKYRHRFEEDVRKIVKKFKACLPRPILEQIVNETEISPPHYNLQLSQKSVLDKLLYKCFQCAPTEETLLLILEEVWNAESHQTQSIQESQLFNFICSQSVMSSQASQENEIVHQLVSYLEANSQSLSSESNEPLFAIICPKTAGEYSRGDSSESSKSITLLRNPREIILPGDNIRGVQMSHSDLKNKEKTQTCFEQSRTYVNSAKTPQMSDIENVAIIVNDDDETNKVLVITDDDQQAKPDNIPIEGKDGNLDKTDIQGLSIKFNPECTSTQYNIINDVCVDSQGYAGGVEHAGK